MAVSEFVTLGEIKAAYASRDLSTYLYLLKPSKEGIKAVIGVGQHAGAEFMGTALLYFRAGDFCLAFRQYGGPSGKCRVGEIDRDAGGEAREINWR